MTLLIVLSNDTNVGTIKSGDTVAIAYHQPQQEIFTF